MQLVLCGVLLSQSVSDFDVISFLAQDITPKV